MSGDVLQVNPAVLDSAGTAFQQAGAGVADLQADAPLADAAGAVPALQTAAACRQAQADISAMTAAVAGAARDYGRNLHEAATRYEAGDRAGRDAIAKVDLPG
ncbi:type VII secretion target [Mycolicibacterium litorale]|uniref:ESX-1 secretion-associated protein n=1 Tax=Mycolicibacterium litorale TaxID=758802 RepID=A0AAD1INW9_9MYCO|nr:type VII secretion target [Mycolicibacterium litorale]MCV7417306.1 hypothetical protein [Mycolicibacterium litorale]TDY05096.1 excreted virulence factor EspC (type VII ESX diderm) [Mycolicibacterium litorale]BBY18529.1 hypothetical protein MLIT_41210 [Mycolicibacterium litorale]